MRDFVNPAARAVYTGVFMAFSCVTPIEHEHASIRTTAEFHSPIPRICSDEEVLIVLGDITTTFSRQVFLIRSTAMKIQREQLSAIFAGQLSPW